MTAVSAQELKDCPFCGGDAEILHLEEGDNEGGSCVSCKRCLASSNVEFGRKENFVSNWNARAQRSPAAKAGISCTCKFDDAGKQLLVACAAHWAWRDAAADHVTPAAPKPPRWYTRPEIVQALRGMRYSQEIADELADWIVLQLTYAFNKGHSLASRKPAAPTKPTAVATARTAAHQ